MVDTDKLSFNVQRRLNIKPNGSFCVSEWLVKIVIDEYEKLKSESKTPEFDN